MTVIPEMIAETVELDGDATIESFKGNMPCLRTDTVFVHIIQRIGTMVAIFLCCRPDAFRSKDMITAVESEVEKSVTGG